ncbi:hypothetical protein HHK36_017680 [Tetracentron sinense]|uniref:Protein kinase domain-containing protein n=1 Tax=Tetracentron sinense TaxID=13715 RepID=A0A834Z0W9_TETSI|nr:hypothetical protein HHK36_017680 [Tetracentron sinense]
MSWPLSPEGCYRLLDVVNGVEGSTKCDMEESKLRATFVIHVMSMVVIVLITYVVIAKTVGMRRFGSYEALPTLSTRDPTRLGKSGRVFGFFKQKGQHRLLVYKFMNNGDLGNFLFGILRPDWNLRAKIAFGIARGLLYLHKECSSQIIHCDIKPQNILLEDYITPRISDFGLAKLLLSDQSRTRTVIRGTKGYVAAEWFRNMAITTKVDVYSLCVMLLEIICCRKSVDLKLDGEERAILTDWAYDCYREGKLDALVENDTEAMSDLGRMERLVKVAIWCIQEELSLRPTMKKVTLMLEGTVEVPMPPCPCPFSYVSSIINVPE